MMKRNFLAAAVAALAVQSAMPAAAEDADKCCFRLTPYYWAVGIDGNLEINDEQGSTDIDFNQDIGDVTDNLEFNGSLMLEHNKGNWSNFAAVDYIKTENDDTDINVAGSEIEVEADTLLATAATGYRFGAGGDSWVDLLVGVRYGKIDLEFNEKNGPGSINADDDLVDGIVMLRPRVALGRNWAFSPTASVGAGDSDLVWELAPELVYTNNCCNLEVRFGYRTVNYEIEEGDAEADFSFQGPMVGLGFAF
ncbi:MAG: outer membrane beta-barrel protein [Gammaproteobacteria bacterium]|nr:outer membrane beta-barrel protein [Gammaproteobacteria bacterium]MBP6479264.1 outer membrane beta-barrel protein [Pseudomonadales bacterium]MBP7909264.1 outer membrane beta-barrel protein [Pseudomonadales bacterium]